MAIASRVGVVAAALALLAGGAYFQANRAEQKARQRLVRQYVDKGAQLMNSGDPSGALPWFVEAMKLDKGDPVRESIHRMRIGACSQDAPRPVHVWFHQRRVGYAEFSRDGLRVATASDDGTACVWDTKTGELIAKVKHNGWVNHAAFSPDGRRIVTASLDKTAQVWDALTGQALCSALQHTSSVWHVAFSPAGDRVLTACEDGMARVWDASTGELILTLKHRFPVTHALFSLTAVG